MAKLIPIITTLDNSQSNRELDKLESRFRGLSTFSARMNLDSLPIGFDINSFKNQLQQIESLTSRQAQFARVNYQTTSKYAVEAARQATIAKQSELRVYENTEKSKQRLVEIGAKFYVQQHQNAFRASEAAKRREFSEFQRIEREKSRLSSQQSGFGTRTVLAGAGSAALGIGAGLVLKAGAEYQQAMNVFGAATKATDAEMKAAARTAKELGADVKLPATSAKDAALAMTELGKANLTARQAMEAARGTLQLAAAGQLDEAKAAEITANALNSFHLEAKESVRVADLLAAAANRSSAEVSDIAEAMSQASAMAYGAKIPIEDLTAAIAILANNGIKGSDAGTSLKTFIQRLQSPTDAAAASMERLGIKVYDLDGRMRSLPEIIGQFDKSLKGLTDQEKAQAFNTIFGADAVRAAQILFSESRNGFEIMKSQVTQVGAAAELAEAKTRGVTGAWGALKSQLETIGVEAFEKLAPMLESGLTAATAFAALVGQYPELFGAVAVAVGGLVLAQTVLNAQWIASAGAAIPAFIGGLKNVIFLMQNVQLAAAMTTAELAAMTLGFTAIVAAVGLVVYAIANMETAIDKANSVSLETINTNAEIIKNYSDLSLKARDVATSQNDSTARHLELNKVLSQLDPLTRTYIESLKDEEKQIKAVTGEIERNLDARKSGMDATLVTVSSGLIEQYNSLKTLNGEIQKYRDQINLLQPALDSVSSIPVSERTAKQALKFSEAQQAIGIYSQKILDTNKVIDELNSQISENEIKLLRSAKANGYSTEQMQGFLVQAGRTNQEIDLLTAGFSRAADNQNKFTNQTNGASDAVGQLTGQVFNLRAELEKLNSPNQQVIDRATFALAQSAVENKLTAAQIKAAREQAIKQSPALAEAIAQSRQYQLAVKESNFAPSLDKENTQKRPSVIRNGINELLPDSGEGFRTYRNRAANYGTQQTIANLQTFAQNWAEISKTPLQIGDIAKAGGGKLAGHKAHTDGNQADFRAVRKDGKLLPVNINDPQYDREMTRRQIQVLKQTIPGAKVLFNDPTLIREGLTQYAKGHDDHYHANRLGGSVYGGDNFRKRFEDHAVEADNRKFAQENMERMRSFYASAKTLNVPDSIVKNYTDFLNKDVKRDRDKLDASEVRDKYFARQDVEVSANTGDVMRTLELRKDVDEQHISDLRVALGLEKGANAEKDRYQKLIERERNIMSEVEVLLEDQSVARREALVQAEVDYQLLKNRNTAEEANVTFYQERNDRMRELGDIEIRLINLRRTNADDQAREQRQLLLQKKEEESLEFSISDLRDRIALADSGINDSLKIQEAYLQDILEIKNRDLAATIEINRATLELANAGAFSSTQVKARVLSDISNSVGTINDALADGIVSAFEKGVDYLDKRLGKIGEIPVVGDLLKFQNRQTMANLTIGLMDALLPDNSLTAAFKESQLTVSEKITKSNDYLKQIADAVTGRGPVSAALNSGFGSGFVQPQNAGRGGILGSVLGSILGNRTGNLPINYAGGDIGRSIILPGGEVYESGSSGGFSLKNFLTGEGGLFAPRANILNGGKTSAMAGYLGGAGAIAQMLGGVIGGRAGTVLSSAGMGAQVGSMFGPWGAAIGAAAGGIFGIFSANSARRKDEQTRDAAMRQTLDSLNQIKSSLERRPPSLDSEQGISQAREIENAYFQAMNQLADKKTRNIAIKDGNERVRPLVAQIQTAAEAARTFQENRRNTASRFTGEFNTGVYMDAAFREQYDGFKRYNGLMPGNWTGRDYIKALIADEELLLNRDQRLNVIQNAGFDPFVGAGIPNYPETPQPQIPKLNTGASFVSPVTVGSSSSQGGKFEFEFVISEDDTGNKEVKLKKAILKTMGSPEGRNLIGETSAVYQKTGRRTS